MSFEIDQAVLDAALALEPLMGEHSGAGEAIRRVPAPVIEAMKEAGLVRMMTPKSLGGLELDPVTSARVFEEIARFDSAASWILQAADSGDFYCARLPDEGAEEIYAQGPDTMIALCTNQPMAGTPTADRYRVSGRSPLGSAISDADWVMVLMRAADGSWPRQVRATGEWGQHRFRRTSASTSAAALLSASAALTRADPAPATSPSRRRQPARRIWSLGPLRRLGAYPSGHANTQAVTATARLSASSASAAASAGREAAQQVGPRGVRHGYRWAA